MQNTKNTILIILTGLILSTYPVFAQGDTVKDSLRFVYMNESMNLQVEGNAASKNILIILHGGPGGSALELNNTLNFTERMEEKFLVAYWDQRGAGLSSGKNDVKLFTASQFVDDLDHLIDFLLNRYGNENKIFLFGASWGGYLGVSYLEDETRQKKIVGWIEMNGVNNFLDNGKTSQTEIVKNADDKISQGIETTKWQTIKDDALDCDVSTPDAGELGILSGVAAEANDLLVKLEKKLQFSSELSDDKFVRRPESLGKALLNDAVSRNPDLTKITIPVLMLWGEYDMIVPLVQARKEFPKFSSTDKKLQVFTGSGHIPVNHYPESLTTLIIDFIAAHGSNTGVADDFNSNPAQFVLSQNYPNPFNPSTNISYYLPERAEVELQVFNSIGRHIRTLVSKTENAGVKKITWDGKDSSGQFAASGIYFFKIIAVGNCSKYISLKKGILLK